MLFISFSLFIINLPENDWFITLDCGKAIFLFPFTVYGLLGGTGGGRSYRNKVNDILLSYETYRSLIYGSTR